jgi:GT2 family glycosyltransferase
MELTISIVNYHSEEFLPDLFKSISKSGLKAEHEILLSDNGSKGDLLKSIETNYPKIRLIRNNANLGFAKAHNKAIKSSTARFILLLNPDMTLRQDAVQNMLDFMRSHPEAGAVGGKILNLDGSVQLSGKMFPTPLAAIFLSLGIHKLFPNNRVTREYYMDERKYDEVHEVEHVMGSFMMVRRATIEKVGLMDENFFLYCDDVDWGMRINKGGFKVFYLPNAVGTHHKGGSSKKESYRMTVEHHKSLWYFYKKWYSKKYPFLINAIFYAGILLRKWAYLTINLMSREKKVRY